MKDIELVGLPASGKSTICIDVADRIDPSIVEIGDPVDEQRRSATRLQKAWGAISFLVRRPRTTVRILAIVSRTGQDLSHQALKGLNLAAALGHAERSRTNRLLEQGVLQAIWSIDFLAAQPRHRELLSVCRPWLPEITIHVDTAPAEAAARLAGRSTGRSRLDGLSPDQIMGDLVRGDRLIAEILAAWRALDSTYLALEWAGPPSEPELRALAVELTGARHRLTEPGDHLEEATP